MDIIEKAIQAIEFIGYSTYDTYIRTDKFPVLGIHLEEYPSTNNLLEKIGLPDFKDKTCEEIASLSGESLIQDKLLNGKEAQLSIIKGYLLDNLKLIKDITNPKSQLLILTWSLYHPKQISLLLKEVPSRGISMEDTYIVYQYLEHEISERSTILDIDRYHIGITNLYSFVSVIVDWSDLDA